jgi:hypothetical protein
MKKVRFITTIILLVGIFYISCESSDEIINVVPIYDTIKPLSYFPVFPGSYWRYVIYKNFNDDISFDSETDTSYSYDSVSSEYLLHSYLIMPDWDLNNNVYIERYSDTVYVPFLNGEPIYGYNRIDEAAQLSAPTYYQKYPFLSETLGDKFYTHYYDPRWDYLGPYMEVVEKKVDTHNDSIIVLRGDYYGNYNNYVVDNYIYKKDVGLVFYYVTSKVHTDTLYRKKLIDYYIKK